MWGLMNALCKPSLGEGDLVTKLLEPKMGQKLTILNQYNSVNTAIDEK